MGGHVERDPEEPGEVPQLKVSSEGTVSAFATAKEKFLGDKPRDLDFVACG
jgi:hypothetical protein